MRNEIFSQIRKNRIQYYAELKNSDRKKFNSEKVLNGINEQLKTESIMSVNLLIRALELKWLGKISLSKYNFIRAKIAQSNILKTFKTNIKDGFRSLLSVGNRVNHRINLQSEKAAQGFYNVSSKFFEDKYEFSDTSGFKPNSLVLKTAQGRTIEWNLNNYPNVKYLTGDVRFFKQFDNLSAWYKKICMNIMIWLESDRFFEPDEEPELQPQKPKTESSKTIGIVTTVKQTAKNVFDIIKSPERLRTGFRNTKKIFRPLFKSPLIQSVSLIYNADFILHFGNKAFTYLYPVINKFIN